VPENDSSPKSNLAQATFHSIEEVNEATRANGWNGEFRQLSKGRVTSRFWTLRLGSSALNYHRLDKRTHIRQVSPIGSVALAIPSPPHCLLVEGAEVGNHEAILLHPGTEAELVTPNEAACKTLTVPSSVFEATARVIVPRMRMDGQPLRVFQGAPSGWPALHLEMTRLLADGEMSPEDVSNLLCRFIVWIAGEPENGSMEKSLRNGSARRVARRAQAYIEEHFPGIIRMEDLCRYTGVSLRTLQRSFAEYFQVSPSEYIKACRFSAARQALLASVPSHQTVTRIAIASGFTHLGRFSVEYRDYFAESPRETLAECGRRVGADPWVIGEGRQDVRLAADGAQDAG